MCAPKKAGQRPDGPRRTLQPVDCGGGGEDEIGGDDPAGHLRPPSVRVVGRGGHLSWRVTEGVVEKRPAEGTMSAVLVVVLLGRIEPTKRFAVALARGARPGVRMILTSISASTAANDAVNFASRSRITNRKRGQHP